MLGISNEIVLDKVQYYQASYDDYIKAYFLDTYQDFPLDMAINYIVKTAMHSMLPIAKYIKQITKLDRT